MPGEPLSGSTAEEAATRLRWLEEACGVLKLREASSQVLHKVWGTGSRGTELIAARRGDAKQKLRDVGQRRSAAGQLLQRCSIGRNGEELSKSSSEGRGNQEASRALPFISACRGSGYCHPWTLPFHTAPRGDICSIWCLACTPSTIPTVRGSQVKKTNRGDKGRELVTALSEKPSEIPSQWSKLTSSTLQSATQWGHVCPLTQTLLGFGISFWSENTVQKEHMLVHLFPW